MSTDVIASIILTAINMAILVTAVVILLDARRIIRTPVRRFTGPRCSAIIPVHHLIPLPALNLEKHEFLHDHGQIQCRRTTGHFGPHAAQPADVCTLITQLGLQRPPF